MSINFLGNSSVATIPTLFDLLVNGKLDNQEIKKGDPLIVLEAMKMETEIRATDSGVVTDVLVSEGDSVHSGQALLSLG